MTRRAVGDRQSCLELAGRLLLAGGLLVLGPRSGAAPPPAAPAKAANRDTCVPPPESAFTADVRDAAYGARADGSDDTDRIQRALDAVAETGGTVLIPAGTYMINATRRSSGGLHGLEVKSRTTLRMAPGAVLKALPNAAPGYAIIGIANASRINIVGGTLVGDRESHIGREGQWGMGIDMANVRDVVVEGVTARDCWGDGFYLGGPEGCTNITFCRVLADRNRRHGLAIVSAHRVSVRQSVFQRAVGFPGSKGELLSGTGIDIEPNKGDTVSDVTIADSDFVENAGGGISSGVPGSLAGSAWVHDIVVERCRVTGNGSERSPHPGIEVTGRTTRQWVRKNRLDRNTSIGIYVRSGASDIFVTDNVVDNTRSAPAVRDTTFRPGHGILLEETSAVTVTGNTGTGNAGCGLREVVPRGGNAIASNRVAGSGGCP